MWENFLSLPSLDELALQEVAESITQDRYFEPAVDYPDRGLASIWGKMKK